MQDSYDIEKAIRNLSNQRDFAIFIDHMSKMEQRDINDMEGKTTEQIQQLSGKMLRSRELMELVGWESLRSRLTD